MYLNFSFINKDSITGDRRTQDLLGIQRKFDAGSLVKAEKLL